ncbi:MAG: Dolichyl-phosphate-mannose-protein mannosyltransferase [Candidatus Woesebacteria bacterium GW2011_GWA1_40_43]|uniref:Dolichyl-phosphate-mannose-protein mannosyltransferase n=1 Tax=Candidatus Woesebacteria bacterium GW2011_GWA1_40_43 TaxID=1618553 RepID=A0A0G0VPT0_9BACT|nr:MAG: Dolichyl-phosphate-mannose-protein mannosyltransferase [Candidatus Woesebacteria bacterium GW2011_GWA1_40_43]
MMQNNFTLIVYYLIYISSVLGVGNYIGRRMLKLDFGSEAEKTFYAFALGNVFFSLAFVYLGIFHLLYKELILGLYLAGFIFTIYSAHRLIKPKLIKELFLNVIKNPFNLWIFFLFAFILLPLVPNLFLFPTSWDSLAYHLSLPKLYLQYHYFPVLHWFPELAYPIGIESLFGYPESVGDPRISNLIVFTFLLMTVGYLVYGLQKGFDKRIGLIAALLFLFRPILFTEVAVTPMTEYPMAFYGLIFGISMIKFFKDKETSSFALLIIFGSFIFLIKYSGLLLIAAVVLTFCFYIKKEKFKFSWQNVLSYFTKKDKKQLLIKLVLLYSIIPALFWVGRNYIATGNPIHPYLDNVFQNKRSLNQISIIDSIKKDNLVLPTTINRLLAHQDDGHDFLIISETIFFYLMLLTMALGVIKLKGNTRYLGFYALTSLLLILFSVGPLTRYYFPVTPISSLVAVGVIFEIIKKRTAWSYLFVTFFLVVVAIQVDSSFYQRGKFYTNFSKVELLSYFSSNKAKKSLVAQDNYKAIEFMNINLDKSKNKVLVLFDNRFYYLNTPFIYGNPEIGGIISNPNTKNAFEVYEKLRILGVTHIYENTNWGIHPNIREDIYNNFKKDFLIEIFSSQGTTVYFLK